MIGEDASTLDASKNFKPPEPKKKSPATILMARGAPGVRRAENKPFEPARVMPGWKAHFDWRLAIVDWRFPIEDTSRLMSLQFRIASLEIDNRQSQIRNQQ